MNNEVTKLSVLVMYVFISKAMTCMDKRKYPGNSKLHPSSHAPVTFDENKEK